MRLEDWSDAALAHEVRVQRDALKTSTEGSLRWLAARRILHHVSSEQQRRRNEARADGLLSDCVGEEWLARSQRE